MAEALECRTLAVTVETRYGKIRGSSDGGVHVFRGIPFARPPVATRRFRPPEPPEPWPGLRDCRSFAPVAPQQFSPLSALYPAPIEEQSEDCLYLNVWTPSTDGTPRPVLVWIHGGRFSEGGAALPDTNGRRLARRGDVVVVSIQYSMGALGFLHLGDLRGADPRGASNLGLLDQIAALEWVREEIDAFGGNPSNVTIFGGSAGGTSVASLLAMPRARDLFQKAIIQSSHYTALDRQAATRVAQCLLEELEIEERDSVKLRDIPLDSLVRAQRRTEERLEAGFADLVFQPVADGELLPKAPLEAVREGAVAPIPLLVGSNLDEMTILDAVDPTLRNLDEAGLIERMERSLPAQHPSGTSFARRALEVYRCSRERRALSGPAELWCALESDRRFHYTTSRMAELHAALEPRTYMYQFRWTPPATHSRLGAFHGLEVPFVFGTLEEHSLHGVVPKSHEATALARRVQDAWIAFSRTGDPSHPGLGSWPAYAAPRRATMILDESPRTEDAPLENARLFWQEVEEALATRD